MLSSLHEMVTELHRNCMQINQNSIWNQYLQVTKGVMTLSLKKLSHLTKFNDIQDSSLRIMAMPQTSAASSKDVEYEQVMGYLGPQQ